MEQVVITKAENGFIMEFRSPQGNSVKIAINERGVISELRKAFAEVAVQDDPPF